MDGALPRQPETPERSHRIDRGVYASVVRPLLFRLDAERAHNLTIRACEIAGRWRNTRRLAERAFTIDDNRLGSHAMSLDFRQSDRPRGRVRQERSSVSMLSVSVAATP